MYMVEGNCINNKSADWGDEKYEHVDTIPVIQTCGSESYL